MPSKSVVVGSAVGLHARPAAIIAEKAAELGSDVTINGVDASSSLMIMTLGAGNGDTVEVAGLLGDDRGGTGVQADGGADDDGLAGHGSPRGLDGWWVVEVGDVVRQ